MCHRAQMLTNRNGPRPMRRCTQRCRGPTKPPLELLDQKSGSLWQSKIEDSLIQNKSRTREQQHHFAAERQRANDVTQLKRKNFVSKAPIMQSNIYLRVSTKAFSNASPNQFF